ncbi:MAG: DUF4251 domain-containing protein [Prevotella sp.]|nr:DUF4251 domain-containing protein [Prevotella sp.]MBQ6208699.1 DUF4251 domain-containing protein [Prevotella sp.]
MVQIRKGFFFGAFLAMVFCLLACSVSKMTSEEKRMKRMMIAQKVKDSLDNRTFKIDLNYVIPRRMRAHSLEYGYSIQVKGDSVDAYIPFFGEAYRAEYGIQDEGLKYKGPMSGYEVLPVKKDLYRVNILAKKPLDEILYQIEVFENGVATLYVRSLNREDIRFNGEMVINE